MFSFVDRWWDTQLEKDERLAHWWENTNNNRSNICPDWLAEASGFSIGYDLYQNLSGLGNSIGWSTDISLIRGAATKAEKFKIARMIGVTWCGIGYVTGGFDALYQQYHHDQHFGTDVADWFIDKKNSLYNWWEHDDHWWKR